MIEAEPAISQYAERYQVLLLQKSVSYPYRHDSISDGVQMFKELSKKHRFGLAWTAATVGLVGQLNSITFYQERYSSASIIYPDSIINIMAGKVTTV